MTTTPTDFPSRKIPLAKLVDCQLNMRPVDADDPAILALGESLVQRQEVDLIVRPLDDGTFEVLDGKRRLAAARSTGLIDALWCQVREQCTDQEALQVILTTQLHRQDLEPMVESMLVATLLSNGLNHAAVAERLGRSPAWVANRAQLIHLAPSWRDGLAAGLYEWATVGYLEQIARLPLQVQNELATDYKEAWRSPQSVDEFTEEIAGKYLHRLTQAPWVLEDLALVPSVGACSVCVKRSGCQTLLWGNAVGEDERCLDAACWAEKLSAWTTAEATRLAKKNERVLVLVSETQAHHQPAPAHLPEKVQAINRHGLEECKKSEDGALAAVDAETGKRTWVKPAPWCSPQTLMALGVGKEVPVNAHVRGIADGATPADKREAKRIAVRLQAIDEALSDCDHPKLADLLPIYTAFAIGGFDPLLNNGWAEVNAERTDADEANALWEHLVDKLREHLRQKVKPHCLPGLQAIRLLEQLVTLSPEEQEAKAMAEVPEPKGKAKP